MSWRTARPAAPAERRAASPWRWMIRSTSGVGVYVFQVDHEPERVDVRRVDRRQPRRVARLPQQQPAILGQQPPHRPRDVVARLPRMCGTLKRSRTIVTPGRGTGSTVPGPSSPRPKFADLNFVWRSASGDLVEQRRERVVHQRLGVGSGRWGHRAVLAGRDDVARRGGVVVGRGRCRAQHERRRGDRGDPGHGRANYRREMFATLVASAALMITPNVEAARSTPPSAPAPLPSRCAPRPTSGVCGKTASSPPPRC